jgi:O-antigen/teichoic acid export membrane protein
MPIAGFLQLARRPFVRNTFVVMSGTGVAQVIGLVLMPVITRLYAPAVFGTYGSFTAAVGILAAGVTLHYSQALMLPREDSDVANLFALSLVATLLVTLLCGVGIAVFPEAISRVAGVPRGLLLALVPVAVFLAGQSQTLQAWCIRHKMFKRTARAQVLRSLAACGTQIGMGAHSAGPSGLLAGVLVGDLCASVSLSIPCLRRDARSVLREVSRARMKDLAFKYADFPLYLASANVLNAASQGLPVLLLGCFHGLTVAGAYALGVRVVQAPMNLVLTALRQVLFQRVGELHNGGEPLWPLFRRCTAGLFALAAPCALLGFLSFPWFFTVVFGRQWLEAGVYARWLVLWLAMLFCNPPALLFARVLRQTRAMFISEILVLLSRVSVLVVGGMLLAPVQTVALFSVVGVVLNIGIIAYMGLHVHRYDRCVRPDQETTAAVDTKDTPSGAQIYAGLG